MPESAWAAWNYERAANRADEAARVSLHYLMNRLQPSAVRAAGDRVAQPDALSIRPTSWATTTTNTRCSTRRRFKRNPHRPAPARITPISPAPGRGYGFHEDGLNAGLQAAQQPFGDAKDGVGAGG